MEIKDYLESTSDAVSPMFNAVRDSSIRIFQLKIDIHHWVHLENYILGGDHNGRGPRNFAAWRKDMGEDPTVETVRFWRGKLEAMLEARMEAVNTLCASILMIAQAGIKLTLGPPNAWKRHEGTVISSQNECLLRAIWHGRNLAAHVEGLTPGTPSYKYFNDLATRRGIDLLNRQTPFPCRYVVKDLLGWIETYALPVKDTVHADSYPSPYVQDMMRVGALSTAP